MSKSFCPGSGQIGFNQKKFWRLWGLDPNHLPLIRMRRSIAPVLYIIIIDHLNLNSVTSSSHLITPLKYPLPLSRITVSKVNQSRDIWHYNSKELDMEPEEIREILRKKDGGKIDTYVQRNTRKREVQGNLMNLLQTWTHSLLYYKRIYPREAFVERQLLGVTVFSVSSPPLKEYLDTFFASLHPHLQHLNYFQIFVLSSSNCLIERNTLHIQSFQSAQILQENLDDEEKSSIHNQIEMKQFIYDLESFFLKGFINTKQEEVSFRFRMGYRLEKGSDAVPSTVVEEWVKRDKIPSKQQLIVGSLKAESLNLIYEIMSQ